MWKISKGPHVLYLGGTIHVLRSTDYPLPGAYQLAFERAELIGFETDLRQIGNSEFQHKLLLKARYPDGENLADHLSAEALQALRDYCERAGIALESLLPYRPGLAMLTMLGLELARLDIRGEGVDAYFLQRALDTGKTIFGLETAEQQLNLLVNMGRGQESEFILHSLQDIQQLDTLHQQMVEQWRAGNAAALNQLFVAPLARQYPDIYHALLLQRNQAWLPSIEQLLHTEATELVLVGVAHLVGKDGLIRQLEQRGYQVEQI
jgi:hypothetical protein